MNREFWLWWMVNRWIWVFLKEEKKKKSFLYNICLKHSLFNAYQVLGSAFTMFTRRAWQRPPRVGRSRSPRAVGYRPRRADSFAHAHCRTPPRRLDTPRPPEWRVESGEQRALAGDRIAALSFASRGLRATRGLRTANTRAVESRCNQQVKMKDYNWVF